MESKAISLLSDPSHTINSREVEAHSSRLNDAEGTCRDMLNCWCVLVSVRGETRFANCSYTIKETVLPIALGHQPTNMFSPLQDVSVGPDLHALLLNSGNDYVK